MTFRNVFRSAMLAAWLAGRVALAADTADATATVAPLVFWGAERVHRLTMSVQGPGEGVR